MPQRRNFPGSFFPETPLSETGTVSRSFSLSRLTGRRFLLRVAGFCRARLASLSSFSVVCRRDPGRKLIVPLAESRHFTVHPIDRRRRDAGIDENAFSPRALSVSRIFTTDLSARLPRVSARFLPFFPRGDIAAIPALRAGKTSAAFRSFAEFPDQIEKSQFFHDKNLLFFRFITLNHCVFPKIVI